MLNMKKLLTKLLPLVSQATAEVTGSTGAIYLYRFGNVVFFSTNGAFRSKSTSIANNTELSQTIPSGYRPVGTVFNQIPNQTSYQMLQFSPTGSITYFGAAAWNGNAYVSGIWLTTDTMP